MSCGRTILTVRTFGEVDIRLYRTNTLTLKTFIVSLLKKVIIFSKHKIV